VVEHELDYVQRNIKIVTRAILEHAKAIQEGTIKPSYKSLNDLVDLEARLREGVDRRVEVNHKFELRGLSNTDIQKKIDERISAMVKYRSLRHFNDVDDPITVDVKAIEETNG
jgi:hypothetical protein